MQLFTADAMCRNVIVVLVALGLLAANAHSETPAPPTRDAVTAIIRAGIAQLNKQYWSPTLSIWLDRPGDDLRANYEGRRNPPWWPSANAVEVLVDFMEVTGTSDYAAMIESLYELQKNHPLQRARVVAELKKRKQWSEADEQAWQRTLKDRPANGAPTSGYYTDFQNEYLDDSGWWGITWLKMYDRTRAPKYLTTAKTIHAHMARNWMPEKGGGVVWCENPDKQRPNTITNALFLTLSARLYQRTKEPTYLGWAEKTLNWFREQALYDSTALVDAPRHRGDYWSYNQGVFIGGLTALYQATGRLDYLDEAAKVTETVLSNSGLVLPSGVIVEKLGTGGDATLFKGVFVRYLGQLREVLSAQKLHPLTAREIDRCIGRSVESMLSQNLGAEGLFSAEWHEGAQNRTSNFNTQVSALATLVVWEKLARSLDWAGKGK